MFLKTNINKIAHDENTDIPADQDNRVNPLKALDIHDTLPEGKNAPETNKKKQKDITLSVLTRCEIVLLYS